MLGLVHMESCK